MKLTKADLCPDCGKVTNERYRQMKALNRRRWEQIQKLESENDYLIEQLEAEKVKLGHARHDLAINQNAHVITAEALDEFKAKVRRLERKVRKYEGAE